MFQSIRRISREKMSFGDIAIAMAQVNISTLKTRISGKFLESLESFITRPEYTCVVLVGTNKVARTVYGPLQLLKIAP